MVAYSGLTDPDAVERSIEEFDRIGRYAFLEKYGYREAREYFLVTEAGRYDSKAIFAAAYEYQHGVAVAASEIHGGKDAAAGRLADLGFTIEGIDDKKGRLTFGSFDEALAHYTIPLENLPLVREFLAARNDRRFYIPASRPYIAAVPAHGKTKAFIHRGYIWHRLADGSGERIDLPVGRPREGGFTRSAKPERPMRTCPNCHTVLPASGECPYC